MKKRRIQYNELNEEIYAPKYWTKLRLIFIGILLLFFGFLVNFSLEEKINKFLQTALSSNPSCPIQFDKAEVSYFFPKIIMRKPVILGVCFGQYNNRLDFKDIKVSLASPSFYPPGLKLHVEATSGKSYINLYPVISLFSQSVKIEKTKIDAQIFAAMTQANTSPIAGMLSIEGFFEFKSGTVVDGDLAIVSKNFSIPVQRLNNFDIPQLSLGTLEIQAHFTDASTLMIEKLQIGTTNAPAEINLKGQVNIAERDFMGSALTLDGTFRVTPFVINSFAILNLYLPAANTSGTYKMKMHGPLRNPGIPQFL